MRVTTVALMLGLVACGGQGGDRCVGVDDPNGLWPHAARLRLAVYPAAVQCDRGVAPPDAAPVAAVELAPGQPLALDTAPGPSTVALTLFSDSAGTVVLGGACATLTLAGGQSCVPLSIVLAPDACLADGDCGAGTRACCDGRCVDLASDALHCGACATACGTLHGTPACAGGACQFTCDPGFGHCTAGTSGCETDLAATSQRVCGAACIPAAACCAASDCVTPPGPAACYVASCSGTACQYDLRPGAVVNNGTCCVPVHGTCTPGCSLTCDAGWADCDGDPSNGCEQSLNSPDHCGSCTNACMFTNATASCPAQSCLLASCAGGYRNCDGNTSNGCECKGTGCCGTGCQVEHQNGVSGTFFDCQPLGTYDQTQATEACASFTGDASQCHVIACGSGSAVCSDGSATACDCWMYSGSGAGRVRKGGAGNCSCNGSTQSWN